MTGNRCGHDPRRPRLALAVRPQRRPGKKDFPWLIKQGDERASMLYTDRHLFPELGPRKRSERIEAMVLVVRAIMLHTDRLTLRSGRPLGGGEFVGYSMTTIAGWCGLALTKGAKGGRLVPQRAYRAVWDLRDAGYVTLSQPIEERPDGSRRGLAGIRCLTPKLFDRLGLLPRLKSERRKLADEERRGLRAARAQTIAERRQLRRLFRASKRASDLTRRATFQLAERLALPSPAPAKSHHEREQRLLEWSRRNGLPVDGD